MGSAALVVGEIICHDVGGRNYPSFQHRRPMSSPSTSPTNDDDDDDDDDDDGNHSLIS
jgi:hypothetical protein